MTVPTTVVEQRVAISLELSEFGAGSIYIHARTGDEARDAHRLLAEVTDKLRELDAACKAAATKLGLMVKQ
jgi:hypothetical protein